MFVFEYDFCHAIYIFFCIDAVLELSISLRDASKLDRHIGSLGLYTLCVVWIIFISHRKNVQSISQQTTKTSKYEIQNVRFYFCINIWMDNRTIGYLPFLHTFTFVDTIENDGTAEMETWSDFNQCFVHFLNRFNRTAHQTNIMNLNRIFVLILFTVVCSSWKIRPLFFQLKIKKARSISKHKWFNNGKAEVGNSMWWWPDKLNNKK